MSLYSELKHMPCRKISLGSVIVVHELWYILTHGIVVDRG
jgi:hypothetical protein